MRLFRSKGAESPAGAVAASGATNAAATQGSGTPAPATAAAAQQHAQPSEHAAGVTAPAVGDERKRRVTAARRATSAFGQVVAMMTRSEQHAKVAVQDLEWMIAPPVRSGQFLLAGKRIKKNGMAVPTTAVLWAEVSNEIDQQLAQAKSPVRLKPKAWSSGDNVWLMDAIGDQTLVPQMIQKLGTSSWKGKVVKIRTRNQDGTVNVSMIGPL